MVGLPNVRQIQHARSANHHSFLPTTNRGGWTALGSITMAGGRADLMFRLFDPF